jgi:hypothetical protein
VNFKVALSRGLLPACAVAAVVAVSLQGPLAMTASGVGYGGYNCGVKGNGYHDHGKVCPNRPFPGKGITEAPGQNAATTDRTDNSIGGTNAKTETEGTATTANDEDTTATVGEGTSSASNGHGHGHGHGKGHK